MKIGLLVPLAEDEHGRALPWTDLRARAEQAEAAGLDSIWVYDHLLHRFPGKPAVGFWEAWTALSALAAATSRVELGTSVLCAGFRNPAVLAKMATTLDEVSGGRLILGLGAGWHEPEFDAFGLPFDRRVSRFEEALQVIAPLLRTGEVDFAGQFMRSVNGEIRPRGPRPNGPPLMVAAFGPRMMRLTARFADLWNTDWLGPVDHLAERRAALETACHAEGRDPSTLGITGGVTVAYPDLGPLPAWMSTPSAYLTGDAASLGRQLATYAGLDVQHIIANVYPFTEAAVARFAAAASVKGWRGWEG